VLFNICGGAGAQENFPVCRIRREGFSPSGGRRNAMKQFLLNSKPDKNGQLRFEGNDYRYLARVRRLAPGEYFPALIPGAADSVSVRVLSVDKHVLIGEISGERTVRIGASVTHNEPIILFQSLPKGEKMDLIVRQAAEGGIEQIVPFISEFSAIKNIKNTGLKFARWERIIKEARQQSGSPTPTVIQASFVH